MSDLITSADCLEIAQCCEENDVPEFANFMQQTARRMAELEAEVRRWQNVHMTVEQINAERYWEARWRDDQPRIEALEQDSANLATLTGELATRDAIEANLRARIEALEARNREHEERYAALEAMVDHYRRERLVTCPSCGGEGRELHGHPNDPHPKDYGPCEKCHGEGRVGHDSV